MPRGPSAAANCRDAQPCLVTRHHARAGLRSAARYGPYMGASVFTGYRYIIQMQILD